MPTFPTNKYVINLRYRKDRLKEFFEKTKEHKILSDIQVEEGISGEYCPHPETWSAGNGAWGCYKSHVNVIEKCLNTQKNSVIIFEDDAQFKYDFEEKALEFFEHLPEDWEQAYLGGQLIHAKQRPPIRINDHVYRPFNVNRTHCYALSKIGMEKIYKYISNLPFHPSEHIDHHLGRLHEDNRFKVYCPDMWLVGQHGSSSNVSGKHEEVTFYQPPITYAKDHWLFKNPVCVLFRCSPTLVEECKEFLHFGNSTNSDGYDISLQEASKYRYPIPKVTEWYNWVRNECIESERIPAAYHPFLTQELLEQAGARNVVVLEHLASVQEIRNAVTELVK